MVSDLCKAAGTDAQCLLLIFFSVGSAIRSARVEMVRKPTPARLLPCIASVGQRVIGFSSNFDR